MDRRRRAAQATSALLLAAVQAGWTVTELADVMGVSRQTVSKRVNDERRRRGGDVWTGLEVEPPPPPTSPVDDITPPVGERDWLTSDEAAQYLGVAKSTVYGLQRAGLLPATRYPSPGRRGYSQSDLERIRDAPRRGTGIQVDRAAVRGLLRGNIGNTTLD